MFNDFENRRFLISLSFSGDKRAYIASLSNFLRDFIGQDNIFYDYFYEGELSGPDLDIKLQKVYGTQSDIVAVFISQAYQTKEWCFGVEWRVVRDLIKRLEKEKVKFFKFDKANNLEGLLSIDGYINIGKRSPQEIGTILLKLLHNKGKFIIPHNDEVVIRIPNSNLSSEDIDMILNSITSITGKKFLVHGIGDGSTILKLGMFENSHIKLLEYVYKYKRIYKFEVSSITINNLPLFGELIETIYTNRKENRKPVATNRLLEVLNEEGLTQATLFRVSGVNASTINAIARGRNVAPTNATKSKIVNGINKLIGEKNDPKYKVSDIFFDNKD